MGLYHGDSGLYAGRRGLYAGPKRRGGVLPLTDPNLLFWWDSLSDIGGTDPATEVESWTDRSSNGYVLDDATGPGPALVTDSDGIPFLDFNASQRLDLTSITFDPENDFELWIICRPDIATRGLYEFYHSTGVATTDMNYIIPTTNTSFGIFMRNNAGATAERDTLSNPITGSSNKVAVRGIRKSDIISLDILGGPTSATLAATASPINVDSLVLGRRSSGAQGIFDCYALLGFVSGPADATALHEFLKARYKLDL